jgi:hypothetical protein
LPPNGEAAEGRCERSLRPGSGSLNIHSQRRRIEALPLPGSGRVDFGKASARPEAGDELADAPEVA